MSCVASPPRCDLSHGQQIGLAERNFSSHDLWIRSLKFIALYFYLAEKIRLCASPFLILPFSLSNFPSSKPSESCIRAYSIAIKRNEKWTLTHICTRVQSRTRDGERRKVASHFFTINYIPRQGEVFLRRYIPDSRKRCTFPASRCRFYKTERNKTDSPSECKNRK